MEKTRDLTAGKPLKVILIFLVPILIGNVFQQLYSLADTIIIGHTLSQDAFGGVAATGALSVLILNFAAGLASGMSIYTAQRFGAKDGENVRRSVAQGILFAAAVTVVLTVLAVYTADPLLRLLHTEEELLPYARSYIVIIYAYLGTSLYYNFFFGTLRAVGDARTPLYFLIAACVLNVGLDFLFILQFNMGVAGAAYGTVISQGLAAAACAVYTFVKYPAFRLRLSHFKPDFRMIARQARLGLPMAFQFSLIAVGLIFVQDALNRLDAADGMRGAYVVAFGAAGKVDAIAGSFMLSIGGAMAAFVGQNHGAKRADRIREGVRCGIKLAAAGAAVFAVVIIVFARPLTKLFFDDGGGGHDLEQICDLGRTFLLFNCPAYFFLGILGVCRSTLQARDHSVLVVLVGVVEIACRGTISLLAVAYFGYVGVCLSASVTWSVTGLYLLAAYIITMRREARRGGHTVDLRAETPSVFPGG